jgi:hypothetical protein
MAMKAILARKFSPLNFSAIDDYPHPVLLLMNGKICCLDFMKVRMIALLSMFNNFML